MLMYSAEDGDCRDSNDPLAFLELQLPDGRGPAFDELEKLIRSYLDDHRGYVHKIKVENPAETDKRIRAIMAAHPELAPKPEVRDARPRLPPDPTLIIRSLASTYSGPGMRDSHRRARY